MSKDRKDQPKQSALFDRFYQIVEPKRSGGHAEGETQQFWKETLENAFGHAFRDDCSAELKRAASAVHGLSAALETLKKTYPDKLQVVGYQDAHDLVVCLVRGTSHPLLAYWARFRKSPSPPPVVKLCKLYLSGVADWLSTTIDPSTDKPIGIVMARQVVTEAACQSGLQLLPRDLKNAMDAAVEAKARAIRVEWKTARPPIIGTKLASSQRAREFIKAEIATGLEGVQPLIEFAQAKYAPVELAEFMVRVLVHGTAPAGDGMMLSRT